jgi:bile acid:Na+ symporter, BASS family
MLQSINRQLERFMPIITPVSVLIGVFFTDHLIMFSFIIPWVFAFITFSGSLGSSFSSIKGALKSPLPLIVILLLLHVIMPVIAWLVGQIIFTNDHLTVTGLVLGLVIPTGVASFFWVTIYKGNIALALSIILFDTVLSPFLVPFTISVLIGQKVEIDSLSIMNGLLIMVVLPSIFGMVINYVTKGKRVKMGKVLAPFSKVGLASVVMMNGAVIAPYLAEINNKLLVIIGTVFILACSGYLLAWLIGRLLNRDRETIVAMIFTGGMRNNSAGAVIAVQYFPPAVAVPVIACMLFQQVLASTFGALFHHFDRRKTDAEKKLAIKKKAS